jgi:transposase
MLHLSNQCRYYLYEGHADMRKGFDGLCGLVQSGMKRKVIVGDIFVFINRPGSHIKLLLWEGDGFALYYKRLERGSFERPSGSYDSATMTISAEQLSLILQGISLQHIRKRKRYQQAA